MRKLIILGTATNISDADHENTHMVVVGNHRMVLIDGPGNPYSRLLKAGVDPHRLSDIVITHYHPDHAGGIPILLMSLGLYGRRREINVYANQHCMARIQRNLEDYSWKKWHWFQVNFIPLPEEEGYRFLDSEDFSLFSTPMKHFIPNIGIRIETGEKTVVYSGDTAPTPALDRLAMGADILIHESGGASKGHSSARQAGAAAARVGVTDLLLVHYPVGDFDSESLVGEAGEEFTGRVQLAQDFQEIDLD